MQKYDSDRLTQLLLSFGQTLHHEIKARTTSKLNPTQLQALFFIRCENRPLMSEIAKYLSIRPPSVTTLVRELQRMKLVRRVTDPEDKRLIRITLTATGEAFLHDRLRIVNERISELTKPLSEAQRKQLIQILTSILSPR